MPRKSAFCVAVFLFASIPAVAQSHSESAIAQYVKQAAEFSSRARANVYFPNVQSIFNGVQVSFVNVGTGNLTFTRRDVVASGRIPIVVARVYDSAGSGSPDFGPGWRLSAGETISVADNKARLITENGSTIGFVTTDGKKLSIGKGFSLGLFEPDQDCSGHIPGLIAHRLPKGVPIDRGSIPAHQGD